MAAAGGYNCVLSCEMADIYAQKKNPVLLSGSALVEKIQKVGVGNLQVHVSWQQIRADCIKRIASKASFTGMPISCMDL